MPQLYRVKNTIGTALYSAIQLTADNVVRVTEWCGGHPVVEHDALDHSITFAAINVTNRNGTKRAQENDYVVLAPNGEFNVHKPGGFNTLFEPLP